MPRPKADDPRPYNPAVTLILTAVTQKPRLVSDMRLTDTWTWKVVDETTDGRLRGTSDVGVRRSGVHG